MLVHVDDDVTRESQKTIPTDVIAIKGINASSKQKLDTPESYTAERLYNRKIIQQKDYTMERLYNRKIIQQKLIQQEDYTTKAPKANGKEKNIRLKNNQQRITGMNFSRFVNLVDKTTKALIPKIFMEGANVSSVRDVFDIFDSRYVIYLNLSQNEVTRLDRTTLSSAPNLEQLSFSDNQLVDVAPEAFSGNPDLLVLRLDNNQLRTLSNRTFYGLRSLMYLHLSNNSFTDQLLVNSAVFFGCSNISYLTLENCQITSFHVDTFSSLTSLVSLIMSSNKLTHIPDGAFRNLQKLKELHLEKNFLVSVTSHWQLPRTLKTLYLSDNQITQVDDSINGLDLAVLFLHSNRLQSLNTSVQMYMAYRDNITVHGNPWRCDCDLIFLIHFVKKSVGFRGHHDRMDTATTCETPSRIRMVDLNEYSVKCPSRLDHDTVCIDAKCAKCDKGLQRRAVSGSCSCMEGTYLHSEGMSLSKCQACPQQTYKNTTGDGPCSPCSSGSIPVSGPAPMCSCAAGFFTNKDGDCQSCPDGFYKNYAGIGVCTACTTETSDPGCASRQEGPLHAPMVDSNSKYNGLVWPFIIASSVIIILVVIVIFAIFGRRYRARRRLWQRHCAKMVNFVLLCLAWTSA
ncbi:hypothetical protein Btru_064369, partial [Bulinus truncatus]